MDTDRVVFRSVVSVSFNVFSTEKLLRQSVLNVTCPDTFDIVGHPSKGGLHDVLLGPNERDEVCATCGLGFVHCPGHIGHISLPLVTFNPVFFRTLYQLLRGSCFNCHRLLSPSTVCQLTLAQLQVLQYGAVGAVQQLHDIAAEAITDDKGKARNGEMSLSLKQRIDECVSAALEGVDIEDARQNASVKNVVECRQHLVKDFIREHLMGAPRKCSHCGDIRRGMTIQNNSRLVYTTKTQRVGRVPPPSIPRRNLHSYDGFVEDEDVPAEEDEQAAKRDAEEKEAVEVGTQTYLTPVEARKHLRILWEKESPLLRHLFGILARSSDEHENPMDMFFLEALVVPPSRFRPVSFMNGRKYEHPQTVALAKVLQACDTVRSILKLMRREKDKETPEEALTMERLQQVVSKVPGADLSSKLHFAWNTLQVAVNVVVDSELDKLNNNKSTPGIKQILEKKEGLFRKHMMGKRVNYAARSVISPDPYINVEEIGVPMVFASRLSYPEPVTDRNVSELRRAVINGPNVYPG